MLLFSVDDEIDIYFKMIVYVVFMNKGVSVYFISIDVTYYNNIISL